MANYCSRGIVRAGTITATRRMLASLAIAAVGLALSTSPAAGQTPPAETASSGGLYVALGDSLTGGTGATPGHGFVDLLFTHFQSTLGVTDLSKRTGFGMTSGVLRTGGELDKALADINGPSDTRVVTITIGGNDTGLAPCDYFASPACPFRANFSATLADLQAALATDPGEEPLIALAYYNPYVGEPGEAIWDQQLLGVSRKLSCADTGNSAELGLNDIVAQEAAGYGALVANAYPAFRAVGDAYTGPGIDAHPNDAGYAALAEAFRNADSPCAPKLDLEAKKQKLKKKLKFSATVDTDSILVATGSAIKETTEQLAATQETKVEARLKRKAQKRLEEKLKKAGKAKVKIQCTATTEAGGAATDTVKVKLKD
jgi:lysophospholipase L1-like esterase